MTKHSYATVTDLFCGAGGSSLGVLHAGAEVSMAVNHWKLAVETHASNFPKTEHDCNDIAASHPGRYPRTDILIASPECFPAGTIILTKRGPIPIEEVKLGDEVLTHLNRWRPVIHTMAREAETVMVGNLARAVEILERPTMFDLADAGGE